MGFRLKTSKRTKDIFDELGARSNLKPFALSKLAMAMSLNTDVPIDNYESDVNGLELNRQTITAQFDSLYKCLIEQNIGRHLTDDEYFPDYAKKHIDRGAELLLNRYNYSGGTLEKFIKLSMNRGNEI
jgi:DNA sulfur modification protein DndE